VFHADAIAYTVATADDAAVASASASAVIVTACSICVLA
jgi:hypothetical protein